MMGAMDARNTYSKFAVNKYLHTVASCWILSKQSHNARNHEYKIWQYNVSYTLVDRLIEPVISVGIVLKQNTPFDKNHSFILSLLSTYTPHYNRSATCEVSDFRPVQ